MKELNVQGITKLANLIDSLTDGNYTFHVYSDDFQASRPREERWYVVEVADWREEERFVLNDPNSVESIPSGMSKDY